jgi:hypothetical protein
MGDRAYQIIENYVDQLEGAVIEIGAENPREYCADGFGEGSTRFFAAACKPRGLPFYSIDIDEAAYDQVRQIEGVTAFRMKGEDFLDREFPQFGQKIAFAYLDNFDWVVDDGKIFDIYAKEGMFANNENSLKAHLDQAIRVVEHAADRCIILFDDTWPAADRSFTGKGGTAVPYLLEHGFSLLHIHPLAVSVGRNIRRSMQVEMKERAIVGLKKLSRIAMPSSVYVRVRGFYHSLRDARLARSRRT